MKEQKEKRKNSKIINLKTRKNKKTKNKKTIEEQSIKVNIFYMFFFEIIGFILCLLVLFILSGGRNYIKLYSELTKLINVYDTITSDYYGDLDKSTIIDNAIDTMLSSVEDGYTNYSDKDSTDGFLENLEGSYEGIGCMVAMNKENNIYIVNVFENSPSKEAGLLEGDIILEVDGKSFEEKTSEDVSEYVKESKNKQIKFLIKRGEEEKEITVTRKKVEIPSVNSKIIEKEDKKIGYIDISVFSAVTHEQFKKELEDLEKKEIQGLIIDVRDDTGGYLTAVTDISNLFLKKGQIIYQLEDSNKKEKVKDTTKEYRKYPIAVLINKGSASASEILASAIKESYSYKNFIIGTNSYGKGTVQKTKKLSDGSMIKYTSQKWLTPEGNWINEVGVEPTNYIELKLKNNTDNQIDMATDLIINVLK